MDKKQLYRAALVSSPIMAAFAISPVFFLASQKDIKFWSGWLVFTLLTLVIWGLNILLISFEENKKSGKTWKRYMFSYILSVIMLLAFIWLMSFFLPVKNEALPVFYPFINILALNTIVLIISKAILMRSKKVQAEAELAALKIIHLEAEQQQLIQQMQPHFLFNSLSTLNSIISTDTDLAKKYLVKLSNFLRFTISAHENAVVSLAEELTFTKNYIELQQIRFENSFFCTITIPEEKIKQYNIPVYALQSLVENAIKHNSFNENHPLNVNIIFQDDSLIVSNNKMSHKQSPENARVGVGLKNLSQRYLLSSGSDILIKETEHDFVVSLKLIR